MDKWTLQNSKGINLLLLIMIVFRQTGPLVYPAGFVYIYSAFYKLTNNGQNILFAQYLFMLIYMVFIATVFFIYARSKVVRFPHTK